jgi:hypothetical protein
LTSESLSNILASPTQEITTMNQKSTTADFAMAIHKLHSMMEDMHPTHARHLFNHVGAITVHVNALVAQKCDLERRIAELEGKLPRNQRQLDRFAPMSTGDVTPAMQMALDGRQHMGKLD